MEIIKKQETGLSSPPSNSPIQQVLNANGFKKLGSCTDQEMMTVLRYAMVLVGMTAKDALAELEEAVLKDFIRVEYGKRFSTEDIRMAFRWAMSGKTDVDKSFYGKRFSVAYLSNFMEAYDEKKKEMLELEKRNKKPAMELQQDTRPLEERLKTRYEIFEKFVLDYKKLPPMIDVIPCFNYLEMTGKLDLSQENIAAMQKIAEDEMLREIEVAKLKMDSFYVMGLIKEANDITAIDLRTKKKFVEKYLITLVTAHAADAL